MYYIYRILAFSFCKKDIKSVVNPAVKIKNLNSLNPNIGTVHWSHDDQPPFTQVDYLNSYRSKWAEEKF